jgi:hypothetical protein
VKKWKDGKYGKMKNWEGGEMGSWKDGPIKT